jgi:3-oxoacyl-[acyl-carrier-protein] synthase III
MSKSVYINRLAKFLPNDPVPNGEMENYLGMVDGRPSKAKPLVLRNNQIKTRYYALDKDGNPTHTNAQLTAEAIRKLSGEGFNLEDIQLLACGTTSPDQLLPSHSSMVHGELGISPVEILSMAGSCCSGIQAIKYAYLSILAGEKSNAVCTGSELLSTWMKSKNFEKESEKLHELEKEPLIAFEKEFLRWMLSDGAGAALISDKPNKDGISLRIEWIESTSFAGKMETCMWAGGEKQANGEMKGWREFEPSELAERSIMTLQQDVNLLGENIVRLSGIYLKEIIERRSFDPDTLDYFLPHLSSEFFRGRIDKEFKKLNLNIPVEKWFTNLTRFGNVGSASIYFMLEELFNSGKLKKGKMILCGIPESARFAYVYALLTVV